ncbi:MAG: Mov34/MPN/PAD-1 family protein [Deltaproteobacteria bacterium]|nr:Mov34/MPN/PAD-1 family protein [Deltaproteobacteria bacterium]
MAYGWAIELVGDDGRAVGRVGIAPDWRPAVDWTHFDGVRAGVLPARARTDAGAVEPRWDAALGAPYVDGFRVSVRAGDRVATRDIPRRYLGDLARDAAAELAARLGLRGERDVRWLVRATAEPGAAPAPDDAGFAVEPEARPWPVRDAPLAPFVGAAMRVGAPDGGLPVFFPPTVLEATHARARAAGDVETGGVLLGRLFRDVEPPHELFVEVTAELPAEHAIATATAITFTAKTWSAARRAVAARGRDEIVVGWIHSHVDFCRLRNCPPERRRTCTASHPFFSPEDVHLHTTCFPIGWQVALLVSDSAATGGLTSSLYGWSEGMVAPRAFHVLVQGVSHA